MAHVDIRSFTSFSPETSRLNISMCVLTTRDYPWSKITSASASPEIVLLSRECAVAETDFVYTILIFHHHNFPNFFFFFVSLWIIQLLYRPPCSSPSSSLIQLLNSTPQMTQVRGSKVKGGWCWWWRQATVVPPNSERRA